MRAVQSKAIMDYSRGTNVKEERKNCWISVLLCVEKLVSGVCVCVRERECVCVGRKRERDHRRMKVSR